MTTLQEAAMRNALEALETCSYGDYSAKHVVDPSFDGDAVEAAIESLKAALAQQGEQQPVAWYEYNQDLDAWFLAYGHNPKAKTRPLVFGDTAAPAAQAQPVAQPLTNSCHTCDHYQQGKRPGVSIHDDTCYGCSEYYANKWEAKSD